MRERILGMMVVAFTVALSAAAEEDQHAMDKMHGNGHTTSIMLQSAPNSAGEAEASAWGTALPSGAAREASFGGRYLMEATGDTDDVARQCAWAALGLVMRDRAALAECAPAIPDGRSGEPAQELPGHVGH